MTQEQAPRRVRPRPVLRTVQVVRVQKLTPGMVRVTLAGDELQGFELAGQAGHVRLWFPQPGYERPVLPEWTENGPVMPEGHARPDSRVYTPRRWSAEAGELDIDIVLHAGSDGPGSRWASKAAAGDWLTISGPSGPYRIDPEAESFLLAADQAGLPAVQTILDALPPHVRAVLYVEVPDAAEEQPLSSAASFDVTWLHAGHAPVAASRLLAAAVRDAELPGGHLRVFVACEATRMREIRRHLLQERGLEPQSIYTHGYWKQGEANHPDHDRGDD